jgi:hypothetical protein
MKVSRPTLDVEALVREIQRYLAVVNASRAQRSDVLRRSRNKKETP